MAEAHFEKRIFIQTTPQAAYNELSNPVNYLGLQPLLTSVDNVQHHTDEDGQTVYTYSAVEAFRFLGLIPYNNRIHARMTLTRPNEEIQTEVDSPGGVRLYGRFVFEPQDGGVLVRDIIRIQMVWFLRWYVVSQAEAAQETLLTNLKYRLEAYEEM